MPQRHWCWRCQFDVPMLTDAEWQEFGPFLTDMTAKIQAYRENTGATLVEALELGFEKPALAKYQEMTGFSESNVNALWHHRLSDHGPPCSCCGKLLRTAKAKRCLECGLDTG